MSHTADNKHDVQRPTTAPRQNPFSSSLFATANVRSPHQSLDRSTRESRISQASRGSESRAASRQLETRSVQGSIDGSPRGARPLHHPNDPYKGGEPSSHQSNVAHESFVRPSDLSPLNIVLPGLSKYLCSLRGLLLHHLLRAPVQAQRKGQARQPVPPLGLHSTASATSSMGAPINSAAARSATTHSEIASLGPNSLTNPHTSSTSQHLPPHVPQRPLPRGSGSLLSPSRPHTFHQRQPSDATRPLPHRGSDASSRASGASRTIRSRTASCALENIDDPLGSRPSMDAFGSQSSSFAQPLDSHAVARAVAVLRTLPQEVLSCARVLSAFTPDCLLPAQVPPHSPSASPVIPV